MISSGKVLLDQKLEVNKIEPNDPSHLNLSFGEDIVSGPLLINFSISNLSKIAKSIVKVHVKILEGHELKKMLLGKTNPYAKISVGDKEATTNVKKATINPEWNQEFDFVSTDPINDKLILQLFHKTKKTSADHKMTDPICIPIRDLNLTSDKQSIHYDVPISLKKKLRGHLSFEIYSEVENLIIDKKESSKYVVDFTVLETNFIATENVHVSYALVNNKANPRDAVINKKVSLNVNDIQDNAIVFAFENAETHDELCDPFIINLKQFTINEVSEVTAETFLDDEKTGNFSFKLSIKEIAKEQIQEKKIQNEIKNDAEQTDNDNDLKNKNEKLQKKLDSSNKTISSLQSEVEKLKKENKKLKKKLKETNSTDSKNSPVVTNE